jgi:NAD(P)-dependent dehydrogenase (short-subunit alcohol dehydrogenase family)
MVVGKVVFDMKQPITLILGATGRTGGAVVRELLVDPGPERVVARAAGRRRDALDKLARIGAQPVALDLDGVERAPLAARAELVKRTPLGRIGARLLTRGPGTAKDVARLVAFLLSPTSGFITGSCMPIDGGMAVT